MSWNAMNIGPPAGGPTVLRAVNCPSQDLALTNLVFVSRADAALFALSPTDPEQKGYIDLAGSVLSVRPHEAIEPGCIGLNAIHRRNARVSAGDTVGVTKFVPPAVDFDLVLLTVEIGFVSKAKARSEQIDATVLSGELVKRFRDQVFTVGQKASFEYLGTNFTFQVNATMVEGQKETDNVTKGMLVDSTAFVFEAGDSGIKITNQRGGMQSQLFKHKELNFQKLGIGGLDEQFVEIFRRAFASRVFPPSVIARLGIQHVKGMLLYGPPGTGKTLIARQIGKMLNGREPKVVNGPEVLNKYVGASEENIRKLFADAESDYKSRGEESDLHIIIFDEIDAICKQRGSSRDGTGVHDTIVNQLLTKIDGVDALNNILLIGMTNRKDLLDEALLRPGRLEVQVEISLPDEAGRVQILTIHTSKMKDNSFVAPDVDLPDLASRTKNFSGAELEGLVKSAVSFALNRQVNVNDLSQPVDEENIKVGMQDFEAALREVKPAFGAAADTLERYRLNGMLDCGPRHTHLLDTCKTLVEQVRRSAKTPLLTVLLEGPSGSGKTALAATVALESQFPFVKLITADSMVGMSEASKMAHIAKVFDDSYKSLLSVILLDDLERVLEYVNIGPRFSNGILQTLLVLIKKPPPKNRKLLVVATSSSYSVLESMDLADAFNVNLNVPALQSQDIRKVLSELKVFAPKDLDAAVAALEHEMPIKRLLMLVEMAAQGKDGESAEAVYAGERTIDLTHFYNCLQDLA